MILFDEPRLIPLEVWHGLARGTTLFDLRDNKPEYFAGLREFLVNLHHGQALTASEPDTLRLQQARSFQRVIVCGGEAHHPALAAALADLPFPVEIAGTGPYAGKRGATRIFAQQQWQRGVALDLGQTQLKVMTEGHDCCLRRDLDHLPFGPDALETPIAHQRLQDFLRDGLTIAKRHLSAAPDGVVLALPVALDAECNAIASTYPGLYGPVEPLFAELFPTLPWLVLNDAILAAFGFPPRAGEKTLVITLGFGVGGALWTGPPWRPSTPLYNGE